MKIEYDPEADTLTITLREARVKESDAVRPGVIADFGHDGVIVRFEILDASQRMEKPMTIEYVVAEPASALRQKPAALGKRNAS